MLTFYLLAYYMYLLILFLVLNFCKAPWTNSGVWHYIKIFLKHVSVFFIGLHFKPFFLLWFNKRFAEKAAQQLNCFCIRDRAGGGAAGA